MTDIMGSWKQAFTHKPFTLLRASFLRWLNAEFFLTKEGKILPSEPEVVPKGLHWDEGLSADLSQWSWEAVQPHWQGEDPGWSQ